MFLYKMIRNLELEADYFSPLISLYLMTRGLQKVIVGMWFEFYCINNLQFVGYILFIDFYFNTNVSRVFLRTSSRGISHFPNPVFSLHYFFSLLIHFLCFSPLNRH